MAKKFGRMEDTVKMLDGEYIRNNLKELLKRWKMSYSYRPRDSYSLQFTTRIDFNEFLKLNLQSYL